MALGAGGGSSALRRWRQPKSTEDPLSARLAHLSDSADWARRLTDASEIIPKSDNSKQDYARRFQREFSHRHVWSPIESVRHDPDGRPQASSRPQAKSPRDRETGRNARGALTAGVSAYVWPNFEIRSTPTSGCCSPTSDALGGSSESGCHWSSTTSIRRTIRASRNVLTANHCGTFGALSEVLDHHQILAPAHES